MMLWNSWKKNFQVELCTSEDSEDVATARYDHCLCFLLTQQGQDCVVYTGGVTAGLPS
jgi:hypothetical protein